MTNNSKRFSVQIASDLHIEYKNDSIPDPLQFITPSADILILAGDIGSLYKMHQLKGFLERLCPHFKNVLYIPGNHEFYIVPENVHYVGMKCLRKRLHTLANDIDNLYILDRKSVIIENICIVGCILWSNPEIKIPRYIVRINDVTNKSYTLNHQQDLNYIKAMIQYCKDTKLKLVVVTHYCPTLEPLKNARKKVKLYSLYATNLEHLLIKDQVDTWICGHIHSNFDFYSSGGTRVVGNQKGKPKDHIRDYSKTFTLKL